MLSLLVIVGIAAWLGTIVWQLWLAETQEIVWCRIGWVTRATNEIAFEASVFFYWVSLGWGTIMLFISVVSVIRDLKLAILQWL